MAKRTLKQAVKINSIIMIVVAIILFIGGIVCIIQMNNTLSEVEDVSSTSASTFRDELVEKCTEGQNNNSGLCDVVVDQIVWSEAEKQGQEAIMYAILGELAVILGIGMLLACFMYRNHALAEK